MKKRWISLCITAVLSITAIFGACASREAGETVKLTVVIDAGHGGVDGGVTGINTGVLESEINLSIARKLKEYFENAGIKVIMTRTASGGLYGLATNGYKKRDMKRRSEIINAAKPNMVISVHQNKFSSPSRRGAQVFYKKDSANGVLLAQKIQAQLNAMEETVKKSSPLVGDYYILNVSPCAAAIVECGFMSNAEDEALLISDEYQNRIAYTVFKGSVDYLAA